jgi:hypothetical protein
MKKTAKWLHFGLVIVIILSFILCWLNILPITDKVAFSIVCGVIIFGQSLSYSNLKYD